MKERFAYIDALRGVAILGVILTHARFAVTGLSEITQNYAVLAARGVELFFILSAVTLLSVYQDQKISYGQFLTRRFFRIAPMFYLGACFYSLILVVTHQPLPPVVDIFATFLFMHIWVPSAVNEVVPGGWSIGNEAMFYLLFPVMAVYLVTLRRIAVIFVICCVLATLYRPLIPHIFESISQDAARSYWRWGFPCILPAFLCGFFIFQSIQKIALPPKTARLLLALSMALLLLIGAFLNIKMLRSFWCNDLAIALFVFAVAKSQIGLIANPILQSIGRVSYSIYIVHFVFLDHFADVFVRPMIQNINPDYQLVIIFFTLLIPSYLVSLITYRYIEQPMIKMGHALTKRRIDEKAPAAR